MNRVSRKKFFFLVFAVCFISALVFAGIFETIHLDYEHDHDDCSACLYIEAARQVSRFLIPVIITGLFAGPESRKKTTGNSVLSRIFPASLVLLKAKFSS
jgi:hypothetical protein